MLLLHRLKSHGSVTVSFLINPKNIMFRDNHRVHNSITKTVGLEGARRCEPVWPSGKALLRLVSGRTSVRYRFGSPFSSEVVVCGHCCDLICPSLPTETLT